MKKIIFIVFIIFSMISYKGFAQVQNQGKRAKEIEAIKIGFITRRLDLTPEESQKFWPVYYQFQQELYALNQQRRQARLQNANDADKSIDTDLDFDSKMLDLKKKYRIKYAKILSPEKVKSLYTVEKDFREELIKQLKSRSNDDPN